MLDNKEGNTKYFLLYQNATNKIFLLSDNYTESCHPKICQNINTSELNFELKIHEININAWI